MPEAVSGLVRGQHSGVYRLAELAFEIAIRGTRHGLEQTMINTITRDGGQLQGLLGPVRKAQYAYVEGVPERVRHVNAAAGSRPGELFHKVRDALAAFVNKIDDHIARSPLHQLGQQLSDLGAIKARYLDAYGSGKRPTSARKGRSGWRRVSSSLR